MVTMGTLLIIIVSHVLNFAKLAAVLPLIIVYLAMMDCFMKTIYVFKIAKVVTTKKATVIFVLSAILHVLNAQDLKSIIV